jgi:hypothetical protein
VIPVLVVAALGAVVARSNVGVEALLAFLAIIGVSIGGGVAFYLGTAHARRRRSKKRD